MSRKTLTLLAILTLTLSLSLGARAAKANDSPTPIFSDKIIADLTLSAVLQAIIPESICPDKISTDPLVNLHPDAHSSIQAYLRNSGIYQKNIDEGVTFTVTPRENIIISKPGVIQGMLTWRIEIPLYLNHQPLQGLIFPEPLLAQVLVQQTNTPDNSQDILIRQVVLARS